MSLQLDRPGVMLTGMPERFRVQTLHDRIAKALRMRHVFRVSWIDRSMTVLHRRFGLNEPKGRVVNRANLYSVRVYVPTRYRHMYPASLDFDVMDAPEGSLWYDPVTKKHQSIERFEQGPVRLFEAATTIQSMWRGSRARDVAADLRYRPGGPGYDRARADWMQRLTSDGPRRA